MLNYFLMAVGSGIAAQVTLSDVNHEKSGIGLAYANYRLHSDGTIDGNTPGTVDNYAEDIGTWLDWGSASEVWVEYSNVVGGTFNHDPGAGRLVLSTSREFGIIDTINDSTAVVVTFDLTFYDSASGGLPISGPTNVRLSASRTA
jgi:hypothetical protein